MRILIVILVFVISDAVGQDNQWYVKDGKNILNVPLQPSKYYELDNVQHPTNPSVVPGAKNDIFVIYDDGTYFNSRYDQGFSLPGSSSAGYRLKGKSSITKIEYLYFTNKYEEDDFPPTANVVSTGSTNPYEQLVIDGNPAQELLTANHDVVPGKDIVLIVNSKKLNFGCNYKLCFNRNDENNPNSDILTPRNVFKLPGTQTSSFSYPIAYQVDNSDCIDFIPTSSTPYLYFNFNCKINIDVTMFETQSKFTLNAAGKECSDQTVLKEDVNHAHDPNFVEVKRICQFEKDTFVTYHIEFFNDDNSAAANNLKIENIVLPSILDANCISVTSWSAGNVNHTNNNYKMIPIIKNGRLSFEFKQNSNHLLNPYNSEKHKASVGFVEFCVKVKKGAFVSSYKNSLRLGVPNSRFASASYPIKDYYDLPCDNLTLGIEPQNCRRPIIKNEQCGCSCGPTEKKKSCWLWNLFRKKN